MRRSTLVALLVFHVSAFANPGGNVPVPKPPGAELTRLRTEIRLAEHSGRHDLVLGNLRQLRDMQVRLGLADSALHTSLRVVQQSNLAEDRLILANDWRVLSRASRSCGDIGGAVNAAKRMVLILKTTGDKTTSMNATLELLDLFICGKRYHEFRSQSEAALAYYQKQGDVLGQTRVLYRQGESLTAQGHAPGGLSLLHLALRNRDVMEDPAEVARMLFAVARANADLDQWPAALNAYDQALKLQPGAAAQEPRLHGLLARIQEGLGNLHGALRSLRAESRTKDSLLSADKAERAVQLQWLYDVQGQEKELVALREANQAIAQQSKADQGRLRWSLALSAVLVALLAALLLVRRKQRYSASRARLRTRVISGKVKQMEEQHTELAQRNKALSEALEQAQSGREAAQELRSDDEALYLLLEMLKTWTAQFPGAEDSPLVAMLCSRIRIVNLVNSNIRRFEAMGFANLKAHFKSIADAVAQEHGCPENLNLSLSMADDPDLIGDLMPISLLFAGLVRLSMEHAAATGIARTAEATFRKIGAGQFDLLYTDGAGAVDSRTLNSGDLTSAMLLTWANSLKGSIRLLKEEHTTFQFTYKPRSSTALRMAS